MAYTGGPEIKFIQSIKIFLRTRKKQFLNQQMFLESEGFSPIRSGRTRKKHFESKTILNQMFLGNQNGHFGPKMGLFLVILGIFWSIAGPFWAQECFLQSKCFCNQNVFQSNPAGLAKTIWLQKQFDRNLF